MEDASNISIGPRIRGARRRRARGGAARTKHARGARAPARHVYAHLVAKFTTALNKAAALTEIGNV